MRVGDLLEWFAAGTLTCAGYLAPIGRWRIVLCLAIAAVCLFYFAQCYGATTVTIPKRNRVEP